MKIDTGIAVSAITVGRSVPRKKNRIAATNTEAPISLPCSVPIDASMKLACRKVTCGAPCRRAAIAPDVERRLDRAGEMDGVRGRLLLDTENDCRFALETGIAAADAPVRTSPRQSAASGLAGRSSPSAPDASDPPGRDVRPRLRIRYSRPLSSRKPPEVFDEPAAAPFQLLQRNTEFGHAPRIWLHLELAHLAADRDHLRNTGWPSGADAAPSRRIRALCIGEILVSIRWRSA